MRDERWKQADPSDQAIVLLSNIEGTIINCVDGVFPLHMLEMKIMPMIRELRQFHKNYVKSEWE